MKTSDIVADARIETMAIAETFGNAFCLLRESLECFETGNIRGAEMCADDASDCFSEMERGCSQLAAKLSMWAESEHSPTNANGDGSS